MKLLKIGDTFVNSDAITYIFHNEEGGELNVGICFAERGSKPLYYQGEEATALLAWAEREASRNQGEGLADTDYTRV